MEYGRTVVCLLTAPTTTPRVRRGRGDVGNVRRPAPWTDFGVMRYDRSLPQQGAAMFTPDTDASTKRRWQPESAGPYCPGPNP